MGRRDRGWRTRRGDVRGTGRGEVRLDVDRRTDRADRRSPGMRRRGAGIAGCTEKLCISGTFETATDDAALRWPVLVAVVEPFVQNSRSGRGHDATAAAADPRGASGMLVRAAQRRSAAVFEEDAGRTGREAGVAAAAVRNDPCRARRGCG